MQGTAQKSTSMAARAALMGVRTAMHAKLVFAMHLCSPHAGQLAMSRQTLQQAHKQLAGPGGTRATFIKAAAKAAAPSQQLCHMRFSASCNACSLLICFHKSLRSPRAHRQCPTALNLSPLHRLSDPELAPAEVSNPRRCLHPSRLQSKGR